MDRRNFFKRFTAVAAAAVSLPNIKLEFPEPEKELVIPKVENIKGPTTTKDIPHVPLKRKSSIPHNVQVFINAVNYSQICKSLEISQSSNVDFTQHNTFKFEEFCPRETQSEIHMTLYGKFPDIRTDDWFVIDLQIEGIWYQLKAILTESHMYMEAASLITTDLTFRQGSEIKIVTEEQLIQLYNNGKPFLEWE